MNQQTKNARCPERDLRVMAEALAEARQVLDDHLVTYASDVCTQEKVEAARERFRRRGGKINCTAEVTANLTEILQEVGHE